MRLTAIAAAMVLAWAAASRATGPAAACGGPVRPLGALAGSRRRRCLTCRKPTR
jgi:hypothetical protein